MEIKAAHEFLYRLAQTPEDYRDHIRLYAVFMLCRLALLLTPSQSRMAGSLILNITYGIDAQSIDDPYMSMMEESSRTRSQAATPGSFLVDSFPICEFLCRPLVVAFTNFVLLSSEIRSRMGSWRWIQKES